VGEVEKRATKHFSIVRRRWNWEEGKESGKGSRGSSGVREDEEGLLKLR